MSVKIKVVTDGIDKLLDHDGRRRRQVKYAMRAAFLIRQYVPVRENTLRASEPLNSNYEGGILTWNTPYAARHYYEPMHHTHPGTCDHWDEAMWRNKGNDMEQFAEQLFIDDGR